MADEVFIYGKDGWPYTVAAREDYAKKNATVRYIDVKNDADGMQKMLEASNVKGVSIFMVYGNPVRQHVKPARRVPNIDIA